MANFKRKRPRAAIYSSPKDMSHWPRWWDIVFHTRPWRRREKAMLRAIYLGQIDADEAAWPVPKKPHNYYW